MTLSRPKLLIRLGSYSVILGLLCAWASDRPLPGLLPEISVVFMFLLLGFGSLVILVGCIFLCFMEQPTQLLRAGLISLAVTLLVFVAASMARFEPNVHSWTGFMLLPWLLSCLLVPIILLVGFIRLLLQRRQIPRP
jgi:hypothetical protein